MVTASAADFEVCHKIDMCKRQAARPIAFTQGLPTGKQVARMQFRSRSAATTKRNCEGGLARFASTLEKFEWPPMPQ
jgi:hypothetical protein